MSGVAYDYIIKYLRDLIPEHSGQLKEIEDYAKEYSVPIIQKEVSSFLNFMINIKKPKSILELGTAIGYSSIFMNKCSGGKADILTIERDNKMIDLAKNNIDNYEYGDKIKILEGDCLEILKELDGKYDMIFMDAGKGHYNHFLPYCLNLLSEDGVIIADNVLFKGMVASNELLVRRKITIVKRMRKYLEMISNDNELITTIIPMGDGIAVTARRNFDE